MQLVARIAAVLRALEGQSAGLSLGQIAKATGLPRPTVQRLVEALRQEQLVADDPVHGGVRLGAALARMAASLRTDLAAFARPHLHKLAQEVTESVALTVLQDGQAVLLSIANPPGQQIVLSVPVGAALPVHCTANGKAMLAGLPEARLREILAEPLLRRTPRTETSVPALLHELAAAGRTGVAVDLEGSAEGICAVGAGLVDAQGSRYGIAIIAPTSRFQAGFETLRTALLRTRAAIEAGAGLVPGFRDA